MSRPEVDQVVTLPLTTATHQPEAFGYTAHYWIQYRSTVHAA